MKQWILNHIRPIAFFSAFTLFAGAMAVADLSTGTVVTATAGEVRELPVYCVQTDEKKVALTFDAAWGNEDTETLIEILRQHDARATFFIVGQWVDKYPQSVRALYEAGHEIGNHSDTHPHMSALSSSQIQVELNSCADKIEAITGVRPVVFRPPFGEYDNEVILTSRECGEMPIQWDVDSLDWKELSAIEIYERVIGRVQPGSIVLFHNAAIHTPEALPVILDELERQGYDFVTVPELIYTENYSIDHTGKQIPNSTENP